MKIDHLIKMLINSHKTNGNVVVLRTTMRNTERTCSPDWFRPMRLRSSAVRPNEIFDTWHSHEVGRAMNTSALNR
jgi:hypothetical protein